MIPDSRTSSAPARLWESARKHARMVLASAAIPAIAVSAWVLSADAPPAIPTIALSAEPLFAKGALEKPTVTLALSVEFPTVGAQYVSAPNAPSDSTYSPTKEYIGYFDADSCYSYVDDDAPELRRFDRTSAAVNRECSGLGFSGNMMNWAGSSAIDVLRLGLTGGDRIADTPSLTILQRAVLRDNMWNTPAAPSRILSPSLAAGALPTRLLNGYTGTVYVANCLNRIHFGTSPAGSACAIPSVNSNLGTAVGMGESYGPITSYSGTLPPDFTGPCANENGWCTFDGPRQVAYGGDTRWYFMSAPAGYAGCGNGTWGDPAPGATKRCYSRPDPTGYTGPVFSPVTSYIGALPAGFSNCAAEFGRCSFGGIRQVAFGGNGKWRFASVKDGIACMTTVFGNPNGSDSKSCLTRTDPTGWQPPAPTSNTLSRDAFFYARVRVCDTNGSGDLADPRTSYCEKYGSGYYKPVGTLQRYSTQVRVATFGYLLDNVNTRYGGVLRSPMKFIGPVGFEANGNAMAGGNPQAEWDATTGVFTRNPEGLTENISGSINYLNQFGRTGPKPGIYKNYDPLGELYYESVRYLQGLPPTPQATQGMTEAMKDGFPVYTTWVDPHINGSPDKNYSCMRNHIITIGDDNIHEDKSIPGNVHKPWNADFTRAANPAGNEPDFFEWTNVLGAFESNNGASYVDGNGVTQSVSNPGPYINPDRWGQQWYYSPAPGAGNSGYYFAGVAYWANTHDIRGSTWSNSAKRRPGMRITSHFLDVNEYGTMSDQTLRRNMPMWQAAKYGGFDDRSGIGNPFYSSTGVPDNSPWMKIDEPGEPKTYYLASGARSVLNALESMFAAVAQPAASIAGGAISTQSLGNTGGYIYQARFDPAYWTGDVVSYPVTVTGGSTVAVADPSAAQWKAATKLDAMDWTKRKIFVGKAVRGSSTPATEFAWGSIESGAGKLAELLDRPTPGAASDGFAQLRLNFLRGDRSEEGAKFRKRAARLGDIINSGVTYVGAPSSTIGGADYRAFFDANVARTKALYVGANDGMLHAFNAADGSELFAYIPSWMGPKLATLSSPSYTSSYHQSYVDASPAVAEALVNSTWKSVLVSGTGGGGQGVFALDVTNPSTFDANKIMWEFTDRDDADLGNVMGKPQILKFNVAAPGATPQYKWFAVVASGVNNYANDGSFSTTGRPAIFLLDLAKPAAAAWALGSNYYKISVPVDVSVAATKATGILDFTAEGGGANEVAKLYFGDLHGSVWKLDFTKVAASSWSMNTLTAFSTSYDGSGRPTGTPLPLYIARDKTADRAVQSITAAPTILTGPDRGTIVAFGTGKYLEDPDNTVSATSQPQTIYAIYDNGSTTPDGLGGPAIVSGRSRLAAGAVTGPEALAIPAFRWGRAMTDGDTVRSGWYFDLPRSGERQISTIKADGGSLVLGSILPPSASGDACGTGGGSIYDVNLATGAGAYSKSRVGMLASPFLPEFGNAAMTTTDSTGLRTKVVKKQVIAQGASGLQTTDTKTIRSLSGRLSWRQINNYRGTRNQE